MTFIRARLRRARAKRLRARRGYVTPLDHAKVAKAARATRRRVLALLGAAGVRRVSRL